MTMEECNYTYLLPAKLQDATVTVWATAFDDVGTQLIKKTGKEHSTLENDVTTTETPFSVIKNLVSHHYSFTLLVSIDTYNSESKMKVTINKVSSVDYKSDCNALLIEIGHLSTQA
ncbi:hypothetical protein SUGI_0175960 [Cryptomeria japonica]|nr:hypothetical protein SUGI_0175960 [Cryptomeria japonica]